MKKLIIFVFLSLICSVSPAQKLVVNKIDKFTKTMEQETNIQTLYSVNFMASGYMYRFAFTLKKTGDKWTMPASILLSDVEKYDEDSGVTFLLSNDETVTLKTLFTGIGLESFANGHQFDTCFQLSEDDIDKLSKNDVISVRINYLGGHYDRDLKDNKRELIKKMIKLF